MKDSGAGKTQDASVMSSTVPSRRLTATAPEHSLKAERCLWARLGLSWYRARYISWTIKRGASVPGWRRPRNCADARYLANVWAKRSFKSRRMTERWQEQRTLDDFAVTAGNHAWSRAVHEVQRVFPGTEPILLSCSASEGGHGRWVPNSQGSGVGGWLQFYPSTFYRHFGHALAIAQNKGFRVPSSAHSWYSPLGQALAGAWGLTYSRGEWAGSGC